MSTFRCGLLAFDDCDAMNLVGSYEVLLTANRLLERRGAPLAFEVLVVGEREVEAFGGLRLRPETSVADAGDLDVLVVPGAIDVAAAAPDAAIELLVRRSQLVTSVCTGAFFLERLELIDARTVTTHWEDVDALRAAGAPVDDDVRWVDSGHPRRLGRDQLRDRDGGRYLVARLVDRDLAEATARQIDYVWTEHRRYSRSGCRFSGSRASPYPNRVEVSH